MKKIISLLLVCAIFVVAWMFLPARKISHEEVTGKENLILLESPRAGERISSPIRVSGRARGYWYFEASFPVILLSEGGEALTQAPAQAIGEWMTEEFVPFSLVIEFLPQRSGSQGVLILKKDNPSGLPEYDDELRIPVQF